ncbi:hypothetical protein LZ554_000166 [Drepanopeziza brunnea f. sp. 'monogermtubi']|nr:hypothetical protein LZ554_000166 [Drepanopeziza brunnea f. sp. 'monogermtubi']
MFKEVVSLAVILGFVWNILYIEHPDTRSYTIAFVGSLLALSPFVLYWIYRTGVQEGTAPREIFSLRYWRDSRRRIRDGPGDSEHAFLRGPLEDEVVCYGNCKSKQALGLMVRLSRRRRQPACSSLLYISQRSAKTIPTSMEMEEATIMATK